MIDVLLARDCQSVSSPPVVSGVVSFPCLLPYFMSFYVVLFCLYIKIRLFRMIGHFSL